MSARRTVTKVCAVCGGRVRLNSAKYCGKECYLVGDAARRGGIIQQWLAGDTGVVTRADGELKAFARTFLKEEAGNACTSCGWDKVHPVDGIVPLQIDHIDGDSSNHLRENLVVLCPNCHSLTPTYGARNRGSGRKNRHTGT